MNIEYENTWREFGGIAILPAILVEWRQRSVIIGWLIWSVTVEFE